VWRLEDYRVVFVAVGLVGVLLFAVPSLALVVHLPGGERFSELWVLGSGHMAEGYPYNVRAGESYQVYVGVGNHLGGSAYYLVQAKLRNWSEALPDGSVPSPVAATGKMRGFVADGQSWEGAVSFGFGGVAFEGNTCRVGVFRVNGVAFQVDKTADLNGTEYAFEVFWELWLYNRSEGMFDYHGRYVALWLNMTAPPE